MKSLTLILLIALCIVSLTTAYRRHSYRSKKHHHTRPHGRGAAVATTLAPPTGSDSAEDGEPARGLKGFNPLASLQKTQAKCTVEGAYAIKNECSKYVDCPKKGSAPANRFCPSGKFFDHYKRYCITSGEASCKGICPVDGISLVDPNTDKGYLKCYRGVPMPEVCPAGDTFAPAALACSSGAIAKAADDSEE